MTAHKSLLSMLLFLLCLSNSADAQLKLSEPKVDDEETAAESRESDLPTSSRLRKRKSSGTSPVRKPNASTRKDKSEQGPAALSEDSSDATPESTDPSSLASSPGTTSHATSESASKANGLENSHRTFAGNAVERKVAPAWSLISQDPEPTVFFRAAAPRSAAIAEDATLNDVCHVGASCWAVGERGVVIQSGDHGQTWTTAMTPIDCSLQSVCFLTNRMGWIAGYRAIPGTSQLTAVLFQTRDRR
ncbi:MAG: hypothetical protein U0936_22445 [Planctomycetaceae bacterium]